MDFTKAAQQKIPITQHIKTVQTNDYTQFAEVALIGEVLGVPIHEEAKV